MGQALSGGASHRPVDQVALELGEGLRNAAAGQMAQAVSFIAYTWTQRNGAWQLYDIRIVGATTLASKALK